MNKREKEKRTLISRDDFITTMLRDLLDDNCGPAMADSLPAEALNMGGGRKYEI